MAARGTRTEFFDGSLCLLAVQSAYSTLRLFGCHTYYFLVENKGMYHIGVTSGEDSIVPHKTST